MNSDPAKQRGIDLGHVTPILRVADLRASLDYYVHSLGFRAAFQSPNSGDAIFACIFRGHCTLFLSVGDQGHFGSWVWLYAKDVEALHQEFRAAGAKIRNPPTNYSWALEMQVEDLDGNVLRFGSDRRKDEPDGAWLDMNGDRWVRLPDGRHEKLAR